MKPQRNRARDLGFYALIMIILLAVVYTMTTPSTTEKMIYSDVVDLFNEEQVQSFVITGSEITITKRGAQPNSPDATVSYELFSVDFFLYQMMDTIEQQHEAGIIEDYDLYINSEALDAMGLAVPEDVAQTAVEVNAA